MNHSRLSLPTGQSSPPRDNFVNKMFIRKKPKKCIVCCLRNCVDVNGLRDVKCIKKYCVGFIIYNINYFLFMEDLLKSHVSINMCKVINMTK